MLLQPGEGTNDKEAFAQRNKKKFQEMIVPCSIILVIFDSSTSLSNSFESSPYDNIHIYQRFGGYYNFCSLWNGSTPSTIYSYHYWRQCHAWDAYYIVFYSRVLITKWLGWCYNDRRWYKLSRDEQLVEVDSTMALYIRGKRGLIGVYCFKDG